MYLLIVLYKSGNNHREPVVSFRRAFYCPAMTGMTDVVPTGVDGLDEILNGGIVDNATVLVSGNPGTGKSILGMQYLYTGVTEYDEPGIYISFEENADDIRTAAESIGFDRFGELVDEGEIKIYDKRDMLSDGDFTATMDRLLEDFSAEEYDRLVLDSLTMFQLFFDDEREKRTYLLKFSDILKQYGLTSLLINEQGAVFPDTEIGLENFLTDGNIYVIQTPTDSGVNRYVWVAKMRKQDIDTDIFPMEISDGGLIVHDKASGFSMMGGDGGTGASGGPSF
ncbi:KaiC/GvpD/RAD55 family RecA-like ATPase [Halohasta litchfieldiae]|jgi:RecA-superfamily ATPases implicated in signal transduction|uniref:RecA-superfamily ATPase, KaiC/GvpD/RAD55 family n=2 Tax=Halohasta litchfieldiae TaxID=1073996 RepID=A0A1H6QY29_9EURY|nr:KaiC/GvpD/RAD55 family RecA-like ATPase [Halohasta litchfieldiae]SEI48519.1 RecA-superfamily ATPase, KaiC/GvpD/RAD55 family [Halohasta litchfieldiae]